VETGPAFGVPEPDDKYSLNNIFTKMRLKAIAGQHMRTSNRYQLKKFKNVLIKWKNFTKKAILNLPQELSLEYYFIRY